MHEAVEMPFIRCHNRLHCLKTPLFRFAKNNNEVRGFLLKQITRHEVAICSTLHFGSASSSWISLLLRIERGADRVMG